jgi:gamma-glutamylcyclotransferase (GGCT)/AIG2-like uncharacterized protein YtfP
MNLVATYGSLREGFHNNGVMKRANGEFQFNGITKENYNLYSLGSFPAVSLAHNYNETPVVVDVYEVDDDGLQGPLDTLEGYPNFYNRTLVTIVDGIGEEHQAWLYHIDEDRAASLVKSGDWADHYA